MTAALLGELADYAQTLAGWIATSAMRRRVPGRAYVGEPEVFGLTLDPSASGSLDCSIAVPANIEPSN